jgi:hypothetical protein
MLWSAEWWTAFGSIATAVGSIATAIGVILALVSLRYTARQMQEARDAAAADLKQTQQDARDAKWVADNTLFLTTTSILFTYYNDKISSLRTAMAEGRASAANKQLLENLVEKHHALLDEFEQRYRTMLESGLVAHPEPRCPESRTLTSPPPAPSPPLTGNKGSGS